MHDRPRPDLPRLDRAREILREHASLRSEATLRVIRGEAPPEQIEAVLSEGARWGRDLIYAKIREIDAETLLRTRRGEAQA